MAGPWFHRPRGAARVIIDVGGGVDLGFYASDGRTRLTVPSAFFVGPGLSSYVTREPLRPMVRPGGPDGRPGCAARLLRHGDQIAQNCPK